MADNEVTGFMRHMPHWAAGFFAIIAGILAVLYYMEIKPGVWGNELIGSRIAAETADTQLKIENASANAELMQKLANQYVADCQRAQIANGIMGGTKGSDRLEGRIQAMQSDLDALINSHEKRGIHIRNK